MDARHRFQTRIARDQQGRWYETAPQVCPHGHRLTGRGALLVGWCTQLDPPHRTWTCRRCGTVIHNLPADVDVEPMRPVHLEHHLEQHRD